jgi:hypothetical protein
LIFGRDAFFESHDGPKSKVGLRERRIRVRVPHVTLLHRIDCYLRRTAGHAADHLEH